jgi:hypothetical protein
MKKHVVIPTTIQTSEQQQADVTVVQQQQQATSRFFPRVFGNKRLEGILALLDDERINLQFINNMDEGNQKIILDYILEANRIHSYISGYLSDDDIYVLLKYFNDFLARNYPNSAIFQKLIELKVYKPLWSDKYIHLNFTAPTQKTPKLDSTSAIPNVYLIIALLLKDRLNKILLFLVRQYLNI